MHKRAIAMAAASATAVGMLAAMAPATAAPKEGAKKPYAVLMAAEPVLGYDGGVKGIPATEPAKGTKINPKANNVKKYRAHLEQVQVQALKSVGINATPRNQVTVAANGFAVSLTEAEARKLSSAKGVVRVMEDVLKQKQTDVSPDFLGLDGKKESWAAGYTGKGVVVGVIDSGIWPEHPSFADPGGLPEHDAPVPCQFGDEEYNELDKPFECQNKLIGAWDIRDTYKSLWGAEVYNSARDYDGHGTHTASTAAGNRDVDAEIFGIDRGTVSGIAPEAGIIAYSALGDNGGYGTDLAAAIDQAVVDGVDVINYSIGSTSPSLGIDDLAFLFAADAGVFVATSNGNGGPAPSTTGSPAHVPWLTAVGASTTPRTFEATATLGNGDTYTGASITEGLDGEAQLVDSADLGNELCRPDVAFNESIEGKVVLCARGVIARVDKSEAVWKNGGVGMILYNENDGQALVTDNHWVPSVHIRYSEGIDIKEYIAAAGTEAVASLTQGMKAPTQANVMADFSSRGPVGAPGDPNIIRPDVTAPGVNILAGNTPTPGSGRPDQLFQSISGTSMSSPHVAGLFALLKQAHPDWSAAVAKSALMTTARQDVVKEDGTTPADPFDFGAGHVDPGQPGNRGSMFDPGIAFDAGFNDYLAYACGPYPFIFANPGATCASLENAGFSTDPSGLNIPSIGIASVAGSHTVTRILTNVTSQPVNMNAQVEAPAGYSVAVSPQRVKIRPGQQATVSITVTNKSGPVGEWRFGAITWKGTGYDARIPLAVAGALFSAPNEVTHSGLSGTGSIELGIGYTGEFAADAYGLASQVSTSDTVGQDADLTFDPSDVATGGATMHEVTFTGTKLWRFEMGQADVTGTGTDLDIFVLDASGAIVASSTSEGTNELIELVNPADGTYRVFVHGWGVGVGESAEYTFRTWNIDPSADGGSLQVTSAPTSVSVGQTATVEYSWSGATAGTSELGLLVYSDGSGEIGRTLVTVNN